MRALRTSAPGKVIEAGGATGPSRLAPSAGAGKAEALVVLAVRGGCCFATDGVVPGAAGAALKAAFGSGKGLGDSQIRERRHVRTGSRARRIEKERNQADDADDYEEPESVPCGLTHEGFLLLGQRANPPGGRGTP